MGKIQELEQVIIKFLDINNFNNIKLNTVITLYILNFLYHKVLIVLLFDYR